MEEQVRRRIKFILPKSPLERRGDKVAVDYVYLENNLFYFLGKEIERPFLSRFLPVTEEIFINNGSSLFVNSENELFSSDNKGVTFERIGKMN